MSVFDVLISIFAITALTTIVFIGTRDTYNSYQEYVNQQACALKNLSLNEMDLIFVLLSRYDLRQRPVPVLDLLFKNESSKVPVHPDHPLRCDEICLYKVLFDLSEKRFVKIKTEVSNSGIQTLVAPTKLLKKRWQTPRVQQQVITVYRWALIRNEEKLYAKN